MAVRPTPPVPILLFCVLQLVIASSLTPVIAQVTTTITPDASLGTRVEPNGAIHTISGGTILGPNQFHSFDRFDVGTGDTAHFTGPSSIEQIVSRVTGGSMSVIDGTLKSDISGANLYLLNPAGVLFGRNARLDVNGSFHASTADWLRLGADGAFHVSLAEQSDLSVSAPSAFGFLHDAPSGLRIDGSRLAVPTGETLSMIGGDIEIVGARRNNDSATLAAPSGQLYLASVASPGEVALHTAAAAPEVILAHVDRQGSITLMDDALVDVSGDSGGTVRIRSARLDVDDARIRADTEGRGSGGLIDVQVDVLTISSGGRLSVNTRRGSNREGDEGRVSIVATDRVALSGSNSRIESLTRGTGNAGEIVLRTGHLSLANSSKITSETTSNSRGHAGRVTIHAQRIELTGGGSRIQSTTSGRGNAGAVHIETEHLRVSRGRILGTAHTGSMGDAGDVVITADTLIVENAGRIASILSGPGEGGRIDLTVRDLTVQSGGIVTSRVSSASLDDGFESGDAGRVVIRASGKVLVTGRDSLISSSTNGSGDAGQVAIEAREVTVADRGEINKHRDQNAGQGRRDCHRRRDPHGHRQCFDQ